LRVGLRRLRSAFALFEREGTHQALRETASQLFRRLGAARDQVVIEGSFGSEIDSAMRSAGVVGETRALIGASSQASPAQALRETANQLFLLDLLAALQATPELGANGEITDNLALRDRLTQRLRRWHRQVVADVKRFSELDDSGRHSLRKRAKRLRYAVEFCESLFQRRSVRRYVRALKALQERLGAITDVVMAIQAFAPHRDNNPRAMFALGWLVAHRDELIKTAPAQLKAFRKTDVFWK
jgi:triphosphatase